MRAGNVLVIAVAMLLAASCASRTSSQVNCVQPATVPWSAAGAALTRYVNCQRGAQRCTGQTLTQSSAYFVVWQGSCSATFDIAAQNAILANAQQFVNPPTCPATGKPMTISRWEYISDFINGGSSCVVRVRIHYECCGPANPN